MFVVGLLQWWYGSGLKSEFLGIARRVASLYDYFSIDLLARSIFAPYRQISATKVRGSLSVQLRAFTDRLVSRAVGAVMRTVLIIVGAMSIVVAAVVSVVWVVVWLVLPVVPFVGLTLSLIGWVPWTLS